MSIDRLAPPAAPNVATAQTTARPTPTPVRAGASFRAVLAGTGDALSKGANAALSVLPGGSVMATAVRGGTSPMSLAGASAGPLGGVGSAPQGPTTGTGGTTVGDPTTGGSVDQMRMEDQQYLEMQMAMQAEARNFTARTNIAQIQHEAAMAAIKNIRA